ARALVHHAAKIARNRGATIVEAYPHAIDRAMYDEEAWMGPASIFTSEGFTREAGELPYPVLRLRLRV
ncbi:MAG: GNAT family N-acetyltransferase, partial [Polyangiaceae bacterium]